MFPADEGVPEEPVPEPAAGAAGAAGAFCVPAQPAIASAKQMSKIRERVILYCIPERVSWSYMMVVLGIISGRSKLAIIFHLSKAAIDSNAGAVL